MAAKSSEWRPGPNVCRCCFAEGCYKDISTEYFWMGKREVYSEMLTDTFDVSIAYSQSSGPNSNSRLICEPCISRLRDASDFKRQVIECEKTFMQHLDPGAPGLLDVEVHVEPVEPEVKLERVKTERKLSEDDFDDRVAFADDDDDDDDLDDQPLTKLASKMPKKESVDILDLFDNAKAEKRKSSTKVKASPSKKPKKKEVVKPSASKPPSKAAPKPEKKKKDVDPGDAVDIVKHNASTILDNSTAYPFHLSFNTLRCSFCSDRFDDPNLFRAHMDSMHEAVDKTTVLKPFEHSLTRADITNLRCKACIKVFPGLEKLATHLNEEHGLDIDMHHSLGLVPLRLEKDRLECIVCSKQFTRLHKLSRHTGTHFCKHICEICGKYLETRTGMQVHLKNHNSQDRYSCNRCKKHFPSAIAKKEHFQTSNSCQPLKCPLCEERFSHTERRNIHMVEVHGKPKKIYPCTKCDKVFDYRQTLYVHFIATHTDDYNCQYCEKKFPTPQILQEHTNRYHTDERPFKCTVCEAYFHSNNSLKRHMIHHDDSRKLTCTICSRTFFRKDRLKQHLQKNHPDIT